MKRVVRRSVKVLVCSEFQQRVWNVITSRKIVVIQEIQNRVHNLYQFCCSLGVAIFSRSQGNSQGYRLPRRTLGRGSGIVDSTGTNCIAKKDSLLSSLVLKTNNILSVSVANHCEKDLYFMLRSCWLLMVVKEDY
jgi:hypothetical protein